MINKLSNEVINAIAYSRLVSQTFTVAECILLHQWHNGHQMIKPTLKSKYNAVLNEIQKNNWVKPRVAYVDGGELYKGYPGTKNYIKIN